MKVSIRHLLLAALAVAVAAAATGAILAAPAAAAPFTSPDGLWTWSRPLPFGYPASSIAAPAPGELFVATTVGDLLVTSDGGTSWGWSRTSAVPGLTTPQGLQFVSATEGWTWGYDTSLWNAMLLHTTDGGATWQSNLTVPASPGGQLEVRFAGPLSGWVVTSPGSDESCELSTTTDGGQTWSAPRDLPSSEYNTFGAVAPQGGQRALLWELAWSTGAGNGEIVGTEMWRTTDGGATWSAPTMLRGGAEIDDVAFSSPTKGWASGESWPSGDSWLWRTTNGGASWHKARRATGGQILTVGNDVWVGSALHSADGGKTWQTLPRLAGTVSFSDPANGWIADGATFQRTTDGGKTWQHVTPAAQPGVTGVSSLAAVGGETVWGASGRVIRTTDGGQHWRFATKRGVAALAAVSANQAWAVGGKGLVIHTTDGGHHWTRQPSGVGVSLSNVFFVDARHGWAGGGNTLLRTTDGGRHWTTKHPIVGAEISQIDFADASHGIVLLNAGPTLPPVHKQRRTHLGQDATSRLEVLAHGRDHAGRL